VSRANTAIAGGVGASIGIVGALLIARRRAQLRARQA
jgi:hypothetical protein